MFVSMRVFARLVLLGVWGTACGSSGSGEPAPPEQLEPRVVIGVPAGEDELGFAELAPNAELRLQTFGQGGTHVMLAARCIGFGNRAFISVEITNLNTGVISTTPAPVRAQLLYCDVDVDTCDLVPILAMTSGLTEPNEPRDGLPVEVRITVRNAAGLFAEARQRASLSTADL